MLFFTSCATLGAYRRCEVPRQPCGNAPAITREESNPSVACFAGMVLAWQRRLSQSGCGTGKSWQERRCRDRGSSWGLHLRSASAKSPLQSDLGNRSEVPEAENLKEVFATSPCVKRLKDMVFMKGMKVAITSGEFALRLENAERPGLVDYEGLCNLLDRFADRYSHERNHDIQDDESWKAAETLKVIRSKLQERLLATKAQFSPETDASNQVPGTAETATVEKSLEVSALPAAAVPSKFMLYLRADETVDIDTALQESQAEQPLSRDLWERLEGTEPHGSLDWTIAEEMQAEEGEKQMALLQATTELERAYAKRAKELKAMTEDEAGARSTEELFRLDREISGRRNLALLANVDLIFEQVAMKLEKLLEQSTISDWDVSGRQLKTWVYEFALLDKQVAPYRSYLQRKPQDDDVRALDLDELQMLETHTVRLARRVGLSMVERVNQSHSVVALLRRQMVWLTTFWQKIRRGLLFQASGVRLLSQDLQHALKLLLKVLFLKHALQKREANVCRRAVKDLLVLVPFLIILLIPLSPPGHMLVFSLILKVYPDFVPSPFTEHRQNVMRIYREIQPAGEKTSLW